jgi:hypothetical protein
MARIKLARNRTGWWLGALLLIAAIALTYRLARPPELVWWTSPAIDSDNKRLHVLIPAEWKLDTHGGRSLDDLYWSSGPSDWPKWLQWIVPRTEAGSLSVTTRIPGYHGREPLDRGYPEGKIILGDRNAFCWRTFKGGRSGEYLVFLEFACEDINEFNRNYTAICNSLHIE